MYCAPMVQRDDGFRRGCFVSEGAVRSDRILVDTPLLDDDFGLRQRVEDFPIEQFIAEACVEAFAVAIFPRRAWFDESGF